MNENIGIAMILIGLLFNLIGTFGFVRFSDFYLRVQTVLKCVALGTSLVLFGAFIFSPSTADGLKSLLCLVFILFTYPALLHAVARGTYIYGVPFSRTPAMDDYKGVSGKGKEQ
jgi:multicomponent Na+:H+ antiporter subunit G